MTGSPRQLSAGKKPQATSPILRSPPAPQWRPATPQRQTKTVRETQQRRSQTANAAPVATRFAPPARRLGQSEARADHADEVLRAQPCVAEGSDCAVTLPVPALATIAMMMPASGLPALRRVCLSLNLSVNLALEQNPLHAAALEAYFEKMRKMLCSQKVWVAVRVRPQDTARVENSFHICCNVILCDGQAAKQSASSSSSSTAAAQSVGLSNNSRFHFDRVFDSSSTQAHLWNFYEMPVMRCLRQQENACIFAYGQTGSGKTHSMLGDLRFSGADACSGDEGISARAIRSVARLLRNTSANAENGVVAPTASFSFVEIYNESVYDLLATGAARTTALKSSSAGSRVKPDALPRQDCELDKLEDTIFSLLRAGAASRTVGQTVCNARSSRSHAVATLHITWPGGKQKYLHLVDLAGSERAGQYALSDGQLKEGSNINLSLSTLGRVVGALTSGNGVHVPYRDSTLTWMLQESITGVGARSFLLATVNPSHAAETMSTLRYAKQYSILKTDLIHVINSMAAERQGMTRQLHKARYNLAHECSHVIASGTHKWTERLAQAAHVVKFRKNALADVKDALGDKLSNLHVTKLRSKEPGILQIPLPGDGRAFLDVFFPGTATSSGTSVTLKYPARSLEPLAKPVNCQFALTKVCAIQDDLRKIQKRIEDAEQRLRQIMGGGDE